MFAKDLGVITGKTHVMAEVLAIIIVETQVVAEAATRITGKAQVMVASITAKSRLILGHVKTALKRR